MIKQEVTWYSIKENGLPQYTPSHECQLLVKNKHHSYCMIMDAFYNVHLKAWFEYKNGLDYTEISDYDYEILYYTFDLNSSSIDNFFSNIEENHD